ncbi:MAG: EAL domain-containing protein [Elusimicrobiaceae bacterium]|nr:EAL domain-containing protein [Elusimicrobiaceae bacterium]
MVLVAGVGFYWRHVGDMLERDATSQITLAGNETAESFERAIAADQRIVDTIAITVQQNYPWRSRAGLERFLRLQVKYNEFENLGIIPLHGGEVISAKPGLTDRAWLQEILLRGLEEDTFVSARQTDPLGGPEVFVQAASLHNGEEPVGVLFALIPTKRYQSSLKLTSVGDGRVFVVARDGRVEASSSASQDTNIFTTLAQAKFARPNSLESVRKQIQEGKTTFVRYQLNGSPRLLYGMALKINNWYLLSVLPTDFIQAQAQHLTWLSLALFACICLLFGVLLAYMFRLREYSNRQLFNTAFVDSLTGAYNLNRMADIFPQRLRELPENAALALFDILKFKVINDMLGYERGNVVLKQVAFLLRGNLMPGECFCRSTADNFLLLLSYKDRRELRTRLSGLATLIRRNCTVSDSCIMVDGAFGVYELKEPIPFYIALDRAHLALDNAKHSSTDTIQFYDEKDRHRIVRERQLENTMEQSLEAGDFTVELQPKFDFQTGQMKGAEALVRWKQTARGLVRPDDFIPLFEKNGFILRLDMFILQRVARLLSCWKEQGKQQVPVAVNFSRLHLNDSRYISQMLRTLEAYGVSPELIEVELTESVILNNWELAQSVIRGLHNRGFSVAMDDFGSGYSSLNVLKSLQFDTIKLDKEFLSGCEQDATARRVIQGAVEMIKSVGATIVAEGVETAEQAEFLRKIGCDLAQGYYFSRPLATEEFEQLLSQQNK